ncbi:MAG: antibiotic biosynthesis monooxygenase [Bacteroidia bacterium]
MFVVIYSFQVKPDYTAQFEKAWQALTVLIYEHEGSMGSRLHKKDACHYIAYAQWPNRETWKNSGTKLPSEANQIREEMKLACTKIETLHELELIDDLLKTKRFE